MKYKLLFLYLAGFAIDAFTSSEYLFDKETFKAARIQLHLTRKKAELESGSSRSLSVLELEVVRIENRLNSLIKNIAALEVVSCPLFDRFQSILKFHEQRRKVDSCVSYLTEKEIRDSLWHQ